MKTGPKTSRGIGDKDQKILESARLLFSRFGLKNTSIEEIAQHAGLGKGTVYLYFKSKDDIFEAIATQITKELDDSLTQAMNEAATTQEKLKAYILTRVLFFETSFRERGATSEAMLEAQASPVLNKIREEFVPKHRSSIITLLKEGHEKGEFDAPNAELLGYTIFAMLDSCSQPWDGIADEMTSNDKAQAILKIIFSGLLRR